MQLLEYIEKISVPSEYYPLISVLVIVIITIFMCEIKIKIKNILILSTVFLIVACGGESSSSSNDDNDNQVKPNANVSISATDSTTSVQKGNIGIVDLENKVKTSDGSQSYLSNVTPVGTQNSQCNNVEIDANNLTFTIHGSEIGACVYQYEVSDIYNRASTTAVSRVAVQSASGPTAITYNLPPLSQTTVENETINIDLVTELGGSYPTEGILDNVVTVLGSGFAVTDSANNTISYTAANESNVTRVLYTIIAGDDVYLGTIDIAVSTSINTAPQTQNFTYLDPQCVTDKKENCDLISDGKNIVIDLTDRISDPDEGDVAQVIEVYAFDADVSLTNPDDPTSNTITFSTMLPKVYYITYVVSDHRGGYSVGQIEINIVGAFPYIIVDETNDIFAPPMTAIQADYLNLNTHSAYIESEPTGPAGMIIPAFDWETANAICVSKGGTLPTREQFDALFRQEDYNLYKNNGWPSSRPFWTKELTEDKLNAYAYEPLESITNLTTVYTAIGVSEGAYVSCIDRTPSSISIANYGFIASDYYTQLRVSYQTASGVVLPYTRGLIWESSNPSFATVDDNGLAFGIQPDQDVTFTATSYTGGLTDSATMRVTDNLLVVAGVSPDFEAYVPTSSGECYFDLPNGTNSTTKSNLFVELGLGWYGKINENNNAKSKYGVAFQTNCSSEDNPSSNQIRLKSQPLNGDGSVGESFAATASNLTTFGLANMQDLVVKFDFKRNNSPIAIGQYPSALISMNFVCDGSSDISVQLVENDILTFRGIKNSAVKNTSYQPIQPSVDELGVQVSSTNWTTIEVPVDMSPAFREDGQLAQCSFNFYVRNGMDVTLDNIMMIPAYHPAGIPFE